jgi:hypothetical protein
VSIGDHAGVTGLAKDLGQPHVRYRGARCEQITQHLSCTDRRQLVNIADQQQVRPGRDGLGELVGQQQIQHRGLIDHHEIGIQ